MLALLIILSYIMGSIPSGYIIVKKKLNKDVRDYGSGNIGATNVGRVAGKKVGKITAILDMLKAILPVVLTQILLANNILTTNRSLSLGLVALAAILGHNYTIFLKFKGGKGVATSAAAFMFIVPKAFIVTAIVFFGLKLFTKIVSIRSLTAAVVLCLSTWLLGYDKYLVISTFITAVLCFWRHRANIKRLINGTEK
ncbi:glycerol-3-phosphate 1-O-acyltransferase PlsY [Clostridium sartagoforme]|uniref:Glycerol-3-phosphate acyltransferase n=1 Tax=Clostridium sartagoforme TaxID=84031 RepID=A0A4S2DFZ9_9CLOT|nr:glycerol-3-phosphate 1-O-acyltransferase PlsY [Clostridium sartagoforme]TGY40968.1 glycerol-3-phosphate 1-O-acyltransferase PlsY [Clostridium sartagoforme]